MSRKTGPDTKQEVIDKLQMLGVQGVPVQTIDDGSLVRVTIPYPTQEQLEKRAKAREEFIASQPPYEQDPTAVQLYHNLIEERIRCGRSFEFTFLKEIFERMGLKVDTKIEYRWHDWIRGDHVWSARGPISEIWDDEYVDPPKPLITISLDDFEMVYVGEMTELKDAGTKL